MTFHTPVIFTSSPELISTAEARGWVVVTRDGDHFRINRRGSSLPAPASRSDIEAGGLNGPAAAQWAGILDWIQDLVIAPLLVAHPNDGVTDAVLWAARTRGWPIAAAIDSGSPARTAQALALLTASHGVMFSSPEVRAEFVAAWPTLTTELPASPMVEVPASRTPEPAAPPSGGTVRVLLVAYYAGPNPTVGVQRPNYWFENLESLSDGVLSVEIATATPWPDAPRGVHVVPDLGAALLTDATGTTPWGTAWAANPLPYYLTRHVGGYWHLALEEYFTKRNDEFDVVVISGNPFPPMAFSRFAHRHWYARTVHDFRDPFTLNPRHPMPEEAQARAVYDEAGLNQAADTIVVVHPAWIDYLAPGSPDPDIRVVGNGYDERVPAPELPTTRRPGPLRFGHAGQFFPQTPPDTILTALARTDSEFHHIGKPLDTTFGANVIQYGRMPREQVLVELADLDCGVAYITRARTEIPTKVFDYLVSGLDVLLLHQGEHEQSPMWDLLQGVDGVYWVEGRPEAVREFLASYRPTRHLDPERHQPFSRRASTSKLVAVLRELGDHSYPPKVAAGTWQAEAPRGRMIKSGSRLV